MRNFFSVALAVVAQFSLIALSSESSKAQNATTTSNPPLNFFIGADPQFTFAGKDGIRRAKLTMQRVGELTANCTNCSKIFPIAGDLTMDGDGVLDYLNARALVKQQGVKVLDGLGNHDITRIYMGGPFGSAAFDTKDSLYALPSPGLSQAAQGWSVYHSLSSLVENDENQCPGFTNGSAYYCQLQPAMYYTIALHSPSKNTLPSDEDARAFLVQLHNNPNSDSAIAYLKALRTKLFDDGHLDKRTPIILISHQRPKFGEDSNLVKAIGGDKRAGRVRASSFLKEPLKFRSLNVVAHLIGHEECGHPKEKGHCDYTDNIEQDLVTPKDGGLRLASNAYYALMVYNDIPRPEKGSVSAQEYNESLVKWSKNWDDWLAPKVIPIINVNALFHNIFWAVSFDTETKIVSFKRFNKALAWPVFKNASMKDIISELSNNDASSDVYNFPYQSKDWYRCKYDRDGTRPVAIIKNPAKKSDPYKLVGRLAVNCQVKGIEEGLDPIIKN